MNGTEGAAIDGTSETSHEPTYWFVREGDASDEVLSAADRNPLLLIWAEFAHQIFQRAPIRERMVAGREPCPFWRGEWSHCGVEHCAAADRDFIGIAIFHPPRPYNAQWVVLFRCRLMEGLR